MKHIKISDTEIKRKVLQIVDTMVRNKVDGFYKTKGWDPFDPSYLSRYKAKIKITNT